MIKDKLKLKRLERISGKLDNPKNYRKCIQDLVRFFPFSYHIILGRLEFAPLAKWIVDSTRFLDYDRGMNTRVKYAVDGKKEIYRCHCCNKPIRTTMKPLLKTKIFWCSPACQGQDPYLKAKLSSSHKKIVKKWTTRTNLPPEVKVVYHKKPIQYIDSMQERLKRMYELHRKTFEYWLNQDPKLKSYLFEKSYPLDNTSLSLGSRLVWVLNKLQRIPQCKSCGRQLDFIDAKLSHGWPSYCCDNCRSSSKTIHWNTHCKNSHKKYQEMLKSTTVEPLFSEEEWTNRISLDQLFHCKCKICEKIFDAKFDENFYVRNNKLAWFRRPTCFPYINSRKSNAEKDLLAYVKSLHDKSTKIESGNRRVLGRGFELDIWIPSSRIAIEFNGVFWHSLEHDKDNAQKCLAKTKRCEELGIKLIHIWEDEWKFKNIETKLWLKKILVDGATPLDMIQASDKVELDRSKFNKCFLLSGYELVRETEPKVIDRSHVTDSSVKYHVVDCGTLVYQRCKK